MEKQPIMKIDYRASLDALEINETIEFKVADLREYIRVVGAANRLKPKKIFTCSLKAFKAVVKRVS